MYYAVICAIAKDEDEFLKEWVVYHLLLGFDHIIIYDNGSKNPIRILLKEYIEENLVSVQDYPTQNAPQLSAYFHCLKNWKEKTCWMAFIDIDEFIGPLQDNDIRTFLDRFEEYAGVGIHWMMFGSNGHLKRPKGNVIENYTESIGLSNLYKSIVHPREVTYPLSPHHFQYAQRFCVNEDQICLPHVQSYPTASTIQINHYYYKSQQDYEDKIRRGIATPVKNVTERSIQTFYDHLRLEPKKNTAILRFASLVNMFLRNSAKHLAKFIKDQTFTDVEHVKSTLTDLHNLIEKGDIATAEKKYKHIARYVHIPQIYIFGMYIYFFKKDD